MITNKLQSNSTDNCIQIDTIKLPEYYNHIKCIPFWYIHLFKLWLLNLSKVKYLIMINQNIMQWYYLMGLDPTKSVAPISIIYYLQKMLFCIYLSFLFITFCHPSISFNSLNYVNE